MKTSERLVSRRPWSWLRLRPFQVAIVLAALAGTLFAAGLAHRLGDERVEAQEARLVASAGHLLEQQVQQAAALAVGARGFFESSDEVRPAEFARFAGISLGYSGLLHLDWITRVPAGQRAGFERSLGRPISDIGVLPHTRPAGRRASYFPLTYLAPMTPDRRWLVGYDIAATPEVAATLALARDSGQPRLSPQIVLGPAGRGIMVYAPVYRAAVTPRTVAERRSHLSGFIAAVYGADQLMAGVLTGLPADTTLQVFDGDTQLGGPPGALSGATVGTMPVAGRQWTIRVHRPSPSPVLPIGVLAGGLLLGIAIALLCARANRRQEQVREQRDYARSLVSAMQDGMVVITPAGVTSEISRGFCQMTGFEPEELIGVSYPYPYWPEADLGRIQRAFARVRSEGSAEWDLVFLRKGGERFPVILKASVLTDERGTVTGYLATIKDVTERKRAEDDRARQASILRAVLDTAPEAIRMVDLQGRTVVANAASEELIGVPADNDRPRRWFDDLVDRTTDPPRLRAALSAAFADPMRTAQEDFELAGSGRFFRVYTAPVRLQSESEQETILGRLFITREVTEERANERAKDEFIQLASHELRTPLTSILGYTEVLREGDAGELTEEQDHFLGIIERNSRRLLRLVGDLLVVARADAGHLSLEMEELDLGALAAECVQAGQPVAQERRIALMGEVEPLAVIGDRTRLGEVLDNLISNALKFTPPGGSVAVRATRRGAQAVLEVEDSGMGISAGDQQRLFERFFRTEAAMSAAIPGTGLGLSISRMIVEAHGGRIGVESEEGGGAIFRVTLPIAAVAVGRGAGATTGSPA